jgi:hypothetical protein
LGKKNTGRKPIKKWFMLSLMAWYFMLLLINQVAIALAAPEQNVEKLLPLPGFAEDWVMKERIQIYTEKDLYKYINGEAELYYPYGFKALATAAYVRADNPEVGIAADIYEMGSPIDAFGIYSRYRDPDEESVSIGSEGFVNDSQLLFAKDRYFVRLSPSGTVTMEKTIFLACAQSIAKRIPDSAPLKELDILNFPGVIPRSKTYISQGVLGYAFFRKGLLADANLDGNVIRVFVVLEKSAQSAAEAFEEYRAYLEKSKAGFSVNKDGSYSMIVARDPLYKGLVLIHSGTFLIGAAKLADPERAIPMIKQIQSRTTIM